MSGSPHTVKKAIAHERLRARSGTGTRDRDGNVLANGERMTRTEFEESVEQVLADLPEAYARRLDNVEVLIEDAPSAATLREMGLDPRRDTLFGLYDGVPLGERSIEDTWLPDRITLFYKPLVRSFRSPRRIREEIRKTVLHEIAHFFGMDDEEIEDLGY